MKKEHQYSGLRFSAAVLREAFEATLSASAEKRENKESKGVALRPTFSVAAHDGATYNYDTLEEFDAAYSQSSGDARLGLQGFNYAFYAWCSEHGTHVTVEATKPFIQLVFDIFDRNAATATKVVSRWARTQRTEEPAKPVIFIGHGGKTDWKDLRDHLQNMHKLEVLTYESDPHAGYSNPDVIEKYVERATFGLLVFTSEDMQKGGELRARQNVVHELGLLTSRVGRHRAIILFEEGTEEFSNVSGVQQIRFPTGHIRSTYGDVLAVIKREFHSA
jgi:predicted nucleotide-binding protein